LNDLKNQKIILIRFQGEKKKIKDFLKKTFHQISFLKAEKTFHQISFFKAEQSWTLHSRMEAVYFQPSQTGRTLILGEIGHILWFCFELHLL
jgi:hypothetical protein